MASVVDLCFCLCFLAVFLNSSVADLAPPSSANDSNVCSSTQYPKFCRSTLLPFGRGNLNDYGRISLRQSLTHARKFLNLVRTFRQEAPTYFPSTVGALADCEFLAQENVDSLTFSLQSVNSANDLLGFLASDVQTLLSATLTNLDTCLDGLKTSSSSSSVSNGLDVPISNATKLYSVSLNLFDRGWLRHHKHGRELEERKHTFSDLPNGIVDGLPLIMSDSDRRRFETLTKRRVLQASPSSSVKVASMVVVDQNGTGNFITINDAVAAAPNNTLMGSGYYVIYVKEGTYMEYVLIPRNKMYIMMIGDGIGKTIITGNHSVADGSTTFHSFTLAVSGLGFVGLNMTIRNTAGAIKAQAVALRNGADMSSFYSCSFEGYQDTLYTHSLRQFYRDCEISGTVDFIFGNSAVVFQNCRIIARLPMMNQVNTITAQGKSDPNQNTGMVIQNCTVEGAPELLSSSYKVRTFLGRPWRNYSTTVVMQSRLDGIIEPDGWAPWNDVGALSTLFYAEFSNTGPGSVTSNRVTWPGFHLINATDANNFTLTNFVQGNLWLSTTGIPFNTAL